VTRTARYSQVAEVIRRAFNLKRNGVRLLLENLKKIYRLRDLAVHPSGKVQEALLHPELGVGVEWTARLPERKLPVSDRLSSSCGHERVPFSL
jgi:hypothetical protein